MFGSRYITGFILCLLVAFGFGSILGRFVSPKNPNLNLLALQSVRQQKGYQFVNPLLECEASEYTIQSMLRPFKDHLSSEIDSYLAQKRADHISLYFRDLNNGLWTDIDSTEDYSPASLLKVPLMIAYFKKEEKTPGFLQQKIVHKNPPEEIFKQSITSGKELVVGQEYTYDELIVAAITQSSNTAAWELTEHLDLQELEAVYKDMGINFQEDEFKTRVLTTRTYASFFRILFNASYLSRELSERALKTLAQSEYRKGIVAGVPAEIQVAHKFGERLQTASGVHQLHDCGIVYYPNHPYVLCIMTKGSNYESLQSVIADISRVVYEEVHEQAGMFPRVTPADVLARGTMVSERSQYAQ